MSIENPESFKTVTDLHRFLAAILIAGNRHFPDLEVNTGDGRWRRLVDASAYRCPPGRPSPILLTFDDDEEERYPADHPIQVRNAPARRPST